MFLKILLTPFGQWSWCVVKTADCVLPPCMTKVSPTYLSHSLGEWGSSANGLGFKLFNEQVGYNGTDGRTYGFPMDTEEWSNMQAQVWQVEVW